MTFEQLNLDQRIFNAISNCGYRNPTPIQARSIPEILSGIDLVASAQTGTGKTAAFVLPALQKICTNKSKSKSARVLILTPTRELASQITKDIKRYGKFLRINMANLIGGSSYYHQIKDLSRPIDIIVATPGRLLDHMQRKRVDLTNIEMFILDEADRMLDMGFIDDVQDIAKEISPERQTLLFSATIDNNLSHIIRKLLKNPVRVNLSQERIAPNQIKQSIYFAENISHKMKLFQDLLSNNHIFKAIIFSATKINADRLANTLISQGLKAGALHGDLKQNKRNRVVEQLRHGKIQFLVATDVAARGIDIADISHVINFDLPRTCEDYIHRIGRTGRAGKSGRAISFVMPTDMHHLKRIERYTDQKLARENTLQNSFTKTPENSFGKKSKNKHQRHRQRQDQNEDRNHSQNSKRHSYSKSKSKSHTLGLPSSKNFSRIKGKNNQSRQARIASA